MILSWNTLNSVHSTANMPYFAVEDERMAYAASILHDTLNQPTLCLCVEGIEINSARQVDVWLFWHVASSVVGSLNGSLQNSSSVRVT